MYATVTYIPVLVDVALPQNKEKDSELVPTYKKEQTGSTLTKEQNDEIVQFLTRGKAAPEEKNAVQAGCFVTAGQDDKFGSGVHSN